MVSWGFPGSSAGKESAYNVGDLGSIPGLGRSLGEGSGYPLHDSGLENSMDCSPRGLKDSDLHFTSLHGIMNNCFKCKINTSSMIHKNQR